MILGLAPELFSSGMLAFNPGPNPMTLSYSDTAKKITTQRIAWHVLRMKIIFPPFKNSLAYYLQRWR
jgi:hypothetical protein